MPDLVWAFRNRGELYYAADSLSQLAAAVGQHRHGDQCDVCGSSGWTVVLKEDGKPAIQCGDDDLGFKACGQQPALVFESVDKVVF